jgi:hypothetical protein
MKNRTLRRTALLLVATALLALSAGCTELLAGIGAGTFGLGYLVGAATAPTVTTTQCFMNGEEVDCAALPE